MTIRTFTAVCTVGLASVGCSEAVPAPSTGAFTGSYGAASMPLPGEDCQNSQLDNAQIGKVTPNEIQEAKTDGVGGDIIVCRVTDNGGQFEIEGFMRRGDSAYQLLINVPSITPDIVMTNPDGSGVSETFAPGAVTYTSAKNAGKAYASPAESPCKFWFQTPGTMPPGNEGVAEGRVWVTFQCPRLRNEQTSPASTCGLGVSTIALENCDS
jgi:hypothetical protein